MRPDTNLRYLTLFNRLIPLFLIFSFAFIRPAFAQDSSGDFPVLMDGLVGRISAIENAWNPMLAGNIARTRRLEVYSQQVAEIESIAEQALAGSDMNSLRLSIIWQEMLEMDPADDAFRPLLEEFLVKSIVRECVEKGIDAQTVAGYVRSRSATFVADRGNFSHPGFDESSLTGEDRVTIYTCGFGLILLVHMSGGPEQAVGLYENSGELKGYFGDQLVFRGVDLDMEGLPMLTAVLDDPESLPQYNEVYYRMIAGKLLGSGSQFGGEIHPTPEWKSVIADRVYDHIRIPDRLSSRRDAPFYGVDFEGDSLGPEALLGILGPVAAPKIASLLTSTSPMENVSGLDALRWFVTTYYYDEAGELFASAEPLMGTDDFTLAVLAMEAFEADAQYTGRPYDVARRERLGTNLPVFCDLMNRALDDPAIEYLSSTAWIDIFMEGSLTDGLGDCMPMVTRVINADWISRTEGQDIYLQEDLADLISYFIPGNIELFNMTSDAVRYFLELELDSDIVNPFRAWTYVNYLKAAKESGVEFSDAWLNDIMRLRAWAEGISAMILGEELRLALDELLTAQ